MTETTTVEGKYLSLPDSTRIWYKQNQRQGKTFVFIHGNAQNHTVFNPMFKYVDSRNHHAVSYDLVGHGKSQAYADKKYSMSRLAETLHQILIETKCNKPILVGHSMGGMIVLQYAVHHPENIGGLVLLSASDVDPIKVNQLIPLKEIINNIIKKAYVQSDKNLCGKVYPYDNYPQLTEEEILSIGLQYTDPESLEGNFKSTFDYDIRPLLSVLKMPIFILRGEKDFLMTTDMTRDMHQRLNGSTLITIPEKGHNFLIQQPNTVIQIIKKFMGAQ